MILRGRGLPALFTGAFFRVAFFLWSSVSCSVRTRSQTARQIGTACWKRKRSATPGRGDQYRYDHQLRCSAASRISPRPMAERKAVTIGKKYAALSSELTKKMANAHCWLESSAPLSRCHLLTKPPVGGSPMTQRDPTKKAVMVSGIFRPMPHLADILGAASFVDCPGAKEQGDLANRMHGVCTAPRRLRLGGPPTPRMM